ncbi:MAG: hypothetical protein HS115_04950 [Spirochaetales bacterium]|nr:hypothetical protein [Spirochaetales bacterium]
MIQYLYFHDISEFTTFSRGIWFGQGIHSDPLARQAGWYARMQTDGLTMKLELLGNGRTEEQPWQKRFRNVLSVYRFNLKDIQIQADHFSCRQEGFLLELSAIRPHRISLVLKKESIRFAGELRRLQVLRGRWDQALWVFRRFSASRSSRRR